MGGRGSSSGKSKGIGAMGTGIAVTHKNGKVTNYVVTNGGLREVKTARPAPKSKTMTTQEQVKNMLKNSNTKFLSKSDIDKLRKQYQEDRANKPDYELGGGVPWGNKNNRRAARQGRLATRATRRK